MAVIGDGNGKNFFVLPENRAPCFASRRMGAKRELAYLRHSQLSLSLRPSAGRSYRLARAIVGRTFFFKDREDSLGFLCRLECKQPMIVRVACHGSMGF